MRNVGAFRRFKERQALKEERQQVQPEADIQQSAIQRGLHGSKRKEPVPESPNRVFYYRNPKDSKQIKVIHRLYNPYTKDWKTHVATNFHYAEPTPDMKEVSQYQLSAIMKLRDTIPF
tara:strand:+ start:280 stop:633 length:354 start_codon:yes stop_codon:yes gene_type:complete